MSFWEGKKRAWLIVGAVVSGLVAFILVANWITTKHYYISSKDGALELAIPKGALPDGVKPKQIKIEPTTNLPFDLGEGTVGYQITPDGTKLSKPAEVNLVFKKTDDIPIVYHISRDSATHLANQKITVNMERGETTLTGMIDSFSIIIAGKGLYELKIDDPTDKTVGESFDAIASLRNRKSSYEANIDNKKYAIKVQYPIKLSEGVLSEHPSITILNPHKIENLPASQELGELGIYTARGNFRCEKAGVTQLHYQILARELSAIEPNDWVDIIGKWIFGPNQTELISTLEIYSRPFNCKGSTLTTTRSYTPPPDPQKGPQPARPDLITEMEPAEQTQNNPAPADNSQTNKWSPGASSTSDPDKLETDMLVLGGKNYPLLQFKISNNAGDSCGAPHYHAVAPGKSVYTLDYQKLNDPAPNSCGFGKVSEVGTSSEVVSNAKYTEFQTKVVELWQ